MKQLVEILNNASYFYYQKDKEIMPDIEYDRLYDELCLLEKQTNTVLSASPTNRVGFTVLSNLKKARHEQRILSLDKTKDIDKLVEWLSGNEGVLSWKLDGLTIILKYQNGELIQAVTRGNGEIGEDITHNAKVFQNIPLKVSYKEEFFVRGEAVISFSDFNNINESLEDSENYKNPRNLCSGTVRQLNSEICAKRNVRFIAFSISSVPDEGFCDKKSNKLLWLRDLGFDVVEYVVVNGDNLKSSVSAFENKISGYDFATDGLVLTFNSVQYSNSLGSTSKFPKDSIAFKWRDETAKTTLSGIIWNTSRTGLINPVAVFKPVELEGTTVKQASVHNLSIMEELGLGIGDEIVVYKANMIIPQVLENITKSGNYSIPEGCPVCGFETEIKKIREVKLLYCTNPNCSAQLVKSLAHFTSRDAMNIEGLSEETLKKFVENKFLNSYDDIFLLENYAIEIKSLEGFGEKSLKNLIDSIERSKSVMLPNFIYALGINHVGLSNAKLLCKYFKYDFSKIRNANEEELLEIDGFGEIIAHSLSKYFTDNKNNEILNNALQFISFNEPEDIGPHHLAGLTFVITGDLKKFDNRKQLQEYIENSGGKHTASVTGKTSYLINNDISSNSSKNKKAKELGVEVITEDEFIDRFYSV